VSPLARVSRQVEHGAHQKRLLLTHFATLVAVSLHAQERLVNQVFRILTTVTAAAENALKTPQVSREPEHESKMT
jgi:hypothetical protein